MIADRIRSIQAVSGGGGSATDLYYAYRSLILNFDGNFNDSSPNALTLTPYGDAQVVSDATFGTVASFDGSGDYLSLPSANGLVFGLGDFTVEAWINMPVFTPARFIISSSDGGGLAFGFLPNGQLGIGRAGVAWDNSVTHGIAPNTWAHVAVSRAGGSLRFFVNGTQVGATFANTLSYDLTIISPRIGAQGSGYYYIGLLGPLRISRWAVYTSNFTPSQDLFPVVQQLPVQDPWYNKTSLILNIDGTPGSTTFVDSSLNALAVTAVGNAQIVSDATFGTVASFDGNGDYLSVPDNASFDYGTGDFTIECWVNFASSVSGSNYFIVGQGTSAFTSDAGWILARHSSNKLRFIFSDNGMTSYRICDSTSAFLPTVNTWYHIAAVRKSGVVSTYINGVIAGSVSLPQTVFNSSRNLTIAADSLGGIPLIGLIGPTRITEGIARYTTSFTPPTGPFPAS